MKFYLESIINFVFIMVASSTRIPSVPPSIFPRPIPDRGEAYPLWSVMVPVYNCAAYLKETLESIMIQDPGAKKMQIEVCDDASTDADVEKMVWEIGKGRIGYHRQPNNVGHIRNFETCLNRSHGDFVHLLHGDDKVYDGFYRKMSALLLRFPEAGAAFCRYCIVDEYDGSNVLSELEREEPGVLDNWLTRLACEQRIVTPSMVVRRSVYEKLGAFYGVHHCEDWEMWLRIAASYDTCYEPQVMAEYLIRAGSNSSKSFLSGRDLKDVRWLIRSTSKYFTPADWKVIQHTARVNYARAAVDNARKLWERQHHRQGVINQLREGLRLFCGRSVLLPAVSLYLKTIFDRK